jgi:hypothetical protein
VEYIVAYPNNHMKTKRHSKEKVMSISDLLLFKNTNVATKRTSKLEIKGGTE